VKRSFTRGARVGHCRPFGIERLELRTLLSAGSWGEIELGPQTGFNDQPYVEIEMFDGLTGLGPYGSGYGIYPYNYLLLDTGANSILIVSDAAADLEANGYQTEGTYHEQGVAGYTEFDVSAPYRFDVKGSDGVVHTLPQTADQVRILSDPDVHLAGARASVGGIPGLVGMAGMTGYVTSFDLTGWLGASDLFDMTPMGVTFASGPDALPDGAGHRYSMPIDNRVQFDPADGLPPGSPPDAPLPVWADIPFMTAAVAHRGVEELGDFLIDTGAQMSMISQAMAFALGLDANGDGDLLDDAIYTLPIGGIGGTVEVPVLLVEEFRLPTEQGVDLVWRAPDPPRVATVTPSNGSIEVAEGGGADTYQIVLAAQPSSNVTITLTSLDGQLLAVDDANPANDFLVFTGSNWDVPQTVRVTAVDDDSVEQSHSGVISHMISSSDLDFDGAVIENVTVAITDNDVSGPGVVVAPSTIQVSESGATDTYEIVLTDAPTADVTITFVSPDSQLGAFDAAATDNDFITFTPANWNTPQTVIVAAVDDDFIEGTHEATIVHQVTSADARYSGIAVGSVTAIIEDNDNGLGLLALDIAPGIDGILGVDLLTSGVDLTIDWVTFEIEIYGEPYFHRIHLDFRDWESGTGTIYFDLNPAIDEIRSIDVDQTPPTVTLIAPDRVLGPSPLVTVQVADDHPIPDGTPVALDVDLNGDGDFDDAGESGHTTASLTAGEATFAIAPGLAHGSYALRARASDVAGNEGTSALHAIEVVSATIVDNGHTGFTIEQGAGNNGWATHSGLGFGSDFAWTLAAPAGAEPDVATWTFDVTPGSYRVDTTWLASANLADDAPYRVYDGSTLLGTVRVDQRAAPDDFADPEYGGTWKNLGEFYVAGDTLVVTLSDDVAPGWKYLRADAVRVERVHGVHVIESDRSTEVAEEGQTEDGYQVVLSSRPAADVVVTITADRQVRVWDAAAGEWTSATTKTFTPASWDVPQTVMVKAVDDRAPEATVHTGTIAHALSSADAAFNGVAVRDVTVHVADNDVKIIDDDGSGTTELGFSKSAGSGNDGWTGYDHPGRGFYYGDDCLLTQPRPAGAEADVATYTFTVVPGTYQVAATWRPFLNLATDVPYRVYDDTTLLGEVRIDQRDTSPGDFTDAGRAWQRLGEFAITSGKLVVTISDDVARGWRFVQADAVRIESVLVPVTESAGSTEVAEEGATSDTYELVLAQAPTHDVVITVAADSDDQVTVSPATLTFTPANWHVPQTVTVTAIDDPWVEPRVHATTITHAAASADPVYDGISVRDVLVTIADNDVKVIDDADPTGFSTTTGAGNAGFASANHPDAYLGNCHLSANKPSGAEPDVATWIFAVPAGTYEVAATWLPFINRAKDAPYEIWDGDTLVASIAIDQTRAPDDFGDTLGYGGAWERLGTFAIASGTLVVKLSDNVPYWSYVVADAIRVERVLVEIIETDGDTAVAEEGQTEDTYDVVLARAPTADVTITVVPDGQVEVWDAATGQWSGQTTLTFTPANWDAPQTVTIRAVDDASGEGLFHTGTIGHTAASADPIYAGPAGQGLYVRDVQVTITDNDAQVIDDGDLGFTTVKWDDGWTVHNVGFWGDLRLSARRSPTKPADVAVWTFPVIPGTYQVATTWVAYINRATDAPYEIWDDTVGLLAKVLVDQTQAPDDFVDPEYGWSWEILGEYTITSGTLVVKLSDDFTTNSWVCADAVRIEQVDPPGPAPLAALLDDEPASPEFTTSAANGSFYDLLFDAAFGDGGTLKTASRPAQPLPAHDFISIEPPGPTASVEEEESAIDSVLSAPGDWMDI